MLQEKERVNDTENGSDKQRSGAGARTSATSSTASSAASSTTASSTTRLGEASCSSSIHNYPKHMVYALGMWGGGGGGDTEVEMENEMADDEELDSVCGAASPEIGETGAQVSGQKSLISIIQISITTRFVSYEK
jgi:hypothetical protein